MYNDLLLPSGFIGYCKKPTLGNVSSFYVNKRNYNKGEWIAVQCLPGYLPSSETMRCDNPGSSQEWTPPTITCIGEYNNRGHFRHEYGMGTELCMLYSEENKLP